MVISIIMVCLPQWPPTDCHQLLPAATFIMLLYPLTVVLHTMLRLPPKHFDIHLAKSHFLTCLWHVTLMNILWFLWLPCACLIQSKLDFPSFTVTEAGFVRTDSTMKLCKYDISSFPILKDFQNNCLWSDFFG